MAKTRILRHGLRLCHLNEHFQNLLASSFFRRAQLQDLREPQTIDGHPNDRGRCGIDSIMCNLCLPALEVIV